AGAGAAGDDRHPDDLHDPAVPAAVLRPQPGAASRAAADRHGGGALHDRRDGLPHLPRRERRVADADRPGDAAARHRAGAGGDQAVQRRQGDRPAVGPGGRVLDVATGTGDLAIELAGRVAPGGEVVGSDFSEEMLARARDKAPQIAWEWANALELPYTDDSFDAATVGFGARNFSD